MSNANNQTDLLREQIRSQNTAITEQLRLPGIETLHERPAAEIGAALANVIKSRSGITSLTFVIGSHVEITYDGNPHTQLR
jgi:hypothetical protein